MLQQEGQSVLYLASYDGNTELVLLLLKHGAAVDLPNEVRHSNTMYTVDIDTCTVGSHKYAPLFCMLSSGKTGEGAYARDSDISA